MNEYLLHTCMSEQRASCCLSLLVLLCLLNCCVFLLFRFMMTPKHF